MVKNREGEEGIMILHVYKKNTHHNLIWTNVKKNRISKYGILITNATHYYLVL